MDVRDFTKSIRKARGIAEEGKSVYEFLYRSYMAGYIDSIPSLASMTKAERKVLFRVLKRSGKVKDMKRKKT